MSLEQIIARLIGQAESGEAGPRPASAAERSALSQRLRAVVEDDTDEPSVEAADQGLAADALKLATYLDGGMTAAERDTFDAELVRSPARRDELIAAVEWIEQVSAQQELPPADLTALAIALEREAPVAPARQSAGFTAWIEWLLPRPRLAVATSALAMFAIAAVGLDIALHTSPQLRQVIQSQSSKGGPETPGWQQDSTRQSPDAPPVRTFLPPAPQPGDPVMLTAETINAMIAYHDEPSATHRQNLLAALARAGAAGVAADRVQAIALQQQLYERLTKPRGGLPAYISARLSVDGQLAIAIAE